jgi:hypothetical protein
MTSSAGSGGAPVQKVRIERRGGLAGLHVGVERDYAALTAAQRQALDKVVAAGHLPSVAPSRRSVPVGADRFSYRIHLTHADGQQRVIDVPEDGLPSALERLVKAKLP